MEGKILDGLPFPESFPEENFYMIRNLELRNNDVLMTSYPKTGTNWTLYVIYGIIHPEEPPPDSKSLYAYCPFLDVMGLGKSKDFPENQGRMFCTHLPMNYLPQSATAKFVGVIRNPLDTCVSFYKFLQHMSGWEAKDSKMFRWSKDVNGKIPPDFFNAFAQGNIEYGDIFKYIKALYEKKDEPNVHILIFEKMKANPKEEILRLARFLGHAEKLEADNGKLLDKIVEKSTFDAMKKDVTFIHPVNKEVMQILRKGEVGGYRDALTSEQIQVLKDKMESELAGTELLEMWRDI